MEVCFSDLKEKEIVNVYDGRKLGRIIDVLFDSSSGRVKGIVVPGDKKFFKRNEDIFVPLEQLKKIGDDVILVSLQVGEPRYLGAKPPQGRRAVNLGAVPVAAANKYYSPQGGAKENVGYSSYVRYRPLDEKKYK